MKPGGSVVHLQVLSSNPYPEPNQSNFSYWNLIIYLTLILTWSSHLLLGLPEGLFPVDLPVNILKTQLPSSILAICPAHFNLLDLITLTILGKRYKLWSSLYLFISRTALIYKLPSGLWSRCLLLFLLPDLSPMSVVDILRGLTLVLLMKQQ